METQVSIAKIIAWGIMLAATTIILLRIGKRQRDRQRARIEKRLLSPQERILATIHEEIKDWNIDNAKRPFLIWAIASVRFLDGGLKYKPIVGWLDQYGDVQTKTVHNNAEIHKHFETENAAILAAQDYVKRYQANLPTSKVIVNHSLKKQILQMPWFIGAFITAEALMQFFVEYKPYLIAATVIAILASIWRLINYAKERALEIDDNEQIIYPSKEEDIYHDQDF